MSIQYRQFKALSLQQRNQLFSHYAEKFGTFLLDSGQSNDQHQDGRFDIIAVNPLTTISSKDLNLEDPLQYLKDKTQQCDPENVPDELKHLPCIGGLFFALSYDMGKYYEKIADSALDDLELADFFAATFGCILIIDHKENASFLICSDDISLNTYHQIAEQIEDILTNLPDKKLNEEADETIYEDKTEFNLTSSWKANFSEQQYQEAFNQVQSYIEAGDCYQVNLAQRFKANCDGSSWHAYCQLSQENNAPFSAFINTGEADILSLSPERFIRLNDKKVETKPIKGTMPRGQTEEEDLHFKNKLIASKKDQAENLMIVDLMRNDLGRSCVPGSIKVPHLFKLESFQSVHHLVSTIEGKLETNEDAFSLLAHCFPGGSITGTPKIRAMDIIDQLEPNRRTYYCGSIGYIDIRGNMDTNICIRTLVRKDEQIYCWAGGGIVRESVAEKEYQETFDKVSKIIPVLT